MDVNGTPIDGSGFVAPTVLVDKCVGCGLCETRCYKINIQHKRLLSDTAIRIVAGPGKEDRIFEGSYRQLRRNETKEKQSPQPDTTNAPGDGYLPDFLK